MHKRRRITWRIADRDRSQQGVRRAVRPRLVGRMDAQQRVTPSDLRPKRHDAVKPHRRVHPVAFDLPAPAKR